MLLVFGQALTHGYVYDDFAIFSGETLLTRPLTALLFRLDAALQSPAFSHAVNLVLHAIAVVLLPVEAAAVGAVIFAFHPVQVEPVNYVWARSTLLMTVFCLLSLREWRRGREWPAVAWFALALLSKEECVAWPLFLAFLGPRRWRPLSAMAGLSAAAGAWVLWAASTTAGSQAGAQAIHAPVRYLAAQGAAILHYLTALPITGAWAWALVIPIAVAAWRWSPWAFGGFLLLLPSSSIFPANDLVADRRMYLPMIAFATAASVAIRSRYAAPTLGFVLAIFSFRASRVWQSEQTYWTDVLRREPSSVRARIHLARTGRVELLQEAKRIAPNDPLVASEMGKAWLEARRFDLALAEFGRALALDPGNPRAMSNRGVALLLLGQAEAARADFERALRIDPCLSEARTNLNRMGITDLPRCGDP